MRGKDRGINAKSSEEARRVACHPSIVLEFLLDDHNDWLHSIEFIPVGNNGHPQAGAYMNVNVYRRYPKGHPKAGQRDPMDERMSLQVRPAQFGEPTLREFIENLIDAKLAIEETLHNPKAKLLQDIEAMESKLAEMKREASC